MYSKQIHTNQKGAPSRIVGPGCRVQSNKSNVYKRPRRDDSIEDPEQSSGFPPGRIVLVLAIVFGCFGILWPKLLSPMFSGETPVPVKTDEDAISSNRDHSNPSRVGQMGAPHPGMGEGQGKRVPSAVPPLPVRTIDKEWKAKGGPMPGMRPTMGGPGIQPPQPKGGCTMGVLMPIYTIAIIVFFVYTTFKVMFKNKDNEDEEEEVVDDRVFADKIKYDEEYYKNYIKQYSQDEDSRVPLVKPQHENCSHPQNLYSETNSRVENVLEGEEMKKIYSENDHDGDDVNKGVCNDDIEYIDADKNQPKSSSKYDDSNNEKTEKHAENPKKVVEEEEDISSIDPRDLEIKLLKARLEQTDKALERIVAHMGSVTNRLAKNGIKMDDQPHGQHFCTASEANNKKKE